jgi:WD40 repeat protein
MSIASTASSTLKIPHKQQPKDKSTDVPLIIPFSQPATSLSISPTGKNVALAGKRGLYLFDLDQPFDAPSVLDFHTKWSVADIQWNPHRSRQEWIASTSNQVALIWNIAAHHTGKFVQHTLAAHSRAVSDLNWSPFSPEMLATSSMDGFLHCWDLRAKTDKPASSFVAWNSPASHVKFSRHDAQVLASSHENNVKVWDMRKPGAPSHVIAAAHSSKIYGLDWSRKTRGELVTCGQDSLVKFWSIAEDASKRQRGQFLGQIAMGSPIWRARYAPFGDSVLVLPQQHDSSLYLFRRNTLTSPVYSFIGHTEPARDFVWRIKGILTNSTNLGSYYTHDFDLMGEDFQLVTWGKDDTIRTWPIPPEIPILCNHQPVDRSSLLARASKTHSRQLSKGSPVSPLMSGSDCFKPSPTLSVPSPQLSPHPSPRLTVLPIISPVAKIENDFGGYFDDVAEDEDEAIVPDQTQLPISTPVSSTPHDLEYEIAHLSRICQVTRSNDVLHIQLQTMFRDMSSIVRMQVVIPEGYPFIPPEFHIQRTPSLSIHTRYVLTTKLRSTASSLAAQGLPSIQTIIKSLVVEENVQDDSSISASDYEDDVLEPVAIPEQASMVQNVPYPRLCGAVFSASGTLVSFRNALPHPSRTRFTTHTLVTRNQQPVLQATNFTHQPKNMAMYIAYRSFLLERMQANKALEKVDSDHKLLESDEEDDDEWETKGEIAPSLFWREATMGADVTIFLTLLNQYHTRRGLEKSPGTVQLRDYSLLLPISKQLAEEYIMIGHDPLQICVHNAQVCMRHSRPDLAQLWSLAGLIVTRNQPQLLAPDVDATQPPLNTLFALNQQTSRIDKNGCIVGETRDSLHDLQGAKVIYARPNFNQHPVGRQLVHIILSHLQKTGDIQSMALLACVLSEPFPPTSFRRELINAVLQRNANMSMIYRSALTNALKRESVELEHWKPSPSLLGTSTSPGVPSMGTSPGSSSPHVSPTSLSLTNWPTRGEGLENAYIQDGFRVEKCGLFESSESSFPPLFVPLDNVSSYATEFYRASFLDPENRGVYDGARSLYADLLGRWELWHRKAEVKQFLVAEQVVRGDDYSYSGSDICGVCRRRVNGAGVWCISCGHGGCLTCLEGWQQASCCTGCPCVCLV